MLGEMMDLPLTINSLIDHAERYHGKIEVVSVETDGSKKTATWADVARNSRKIASALGKLGVKPGERVATIAWNNLRHLELYFGVAGGGMVCHTINPRLFPEHLIYIINQPRIRCYFSTRPSCRSPPNWASI